MKFKIYAPNNRKPEREYIINIVFNIFLGIEYNLIFEENLNNWIIKCDDKNKLTICDYLLGISKNDWLTTKSLPQDSLPEWRVDVINNTRIKFDDKIPVIYGDKGFFNNSNNKYILSLDLFGSIFFMLTRYEEYIINNNDSFERFIAIDSVASKAGFLDRPIVDEYIDLLWVIILNVWPKIKRKNRKPEIYVTCDVDQPYSPQVNKITQTIKKSIGDLLKRKNINTAIKTINNYTGSKTGNYNWDPLNSFDYIMDINEKYNNRVIFYFIFDYFDKIKDGPFSIFETRIKKIIANIYNRGHKIGIHGSFGSFNDLSKMKIGINNYYKIFNDIGIKMKNVENRQHYLRWITPVTMNNLNTCNVNTDSTLGFADCAGYRCGTGSIYPMFDLINRKELKLKQRPLIVMDTTLFSEQYMNLSQDDQSLKYIVDLKNKSTTRRGQFTLLWHNNSFSNKETENYYEKLIRTLN